DHRERFPRIPVGPRRRYLVAPREGAVLRPASPSGAGPREGPVFDFLARELGGRGAAAVFAFVLGGFASWVLGRWRRMRQRQSILRGDARDTVVIEHHIV